MTAKNMKPKIVRAKPGQGSFGTSIKNTGLSQRETLEAIILNLARLLEIGEVSKQTSARGSEFYRAGNIGSYQSATNTILDMSQRLCDSLAENG